MKVLISLVTVFFLSTCQDFGVLSPKPEKNVFFINTNLSNQNLTKPYYTFLTYNIHRGFGLPPENPPKNGGSEQHFLKLVDAIKSIDADFVALQEIMRNKYNSTIENQIEFLAKQLNMNYAYGESNRISDLALTDGMIGNAILSKYKILNAELDKIDKDERKVCLHADIEIADGVALSLLNIHFTPTPNRDDKMFEVNNVAAIADSKMNPVVILGDFNAFISQISGKYIDTVSLLGERNPRVIWAQGTYTPKNSRIDRILIDVNFFETLYNNLLPEEYWGLSDHIGFYSLLKFK